jgi:hypothetical protein
MAMTMGQAAVVQLGRYKINLYRITRCWQESADSVWVYFDDDGLDLHLRGDDARAFMVRWEALPRPWKEGSERSACVHGFGYTYDPAEYRARPNTIANKRAAETSFQLARHGHHLEWHRGRGTWIGQCRDCDHRSYVSARSNHATATDSQEYCTAVSGADFAVQEVDEQQQSVEE